MKLSYSLLYSLLGTGIFLSSPLEALAFGGRPGGPFSNGSYFPSDGTFSAVIRGRAKDDLGQVFAMAGTMQFSTTSGSGPLSASTTTQQNQTEQNTTQQTTTETQGTGGVGSTGISAIYVTGSAFGNAYYGNSQGYMDPAGSKITIAFQASAQGQGEQTFTQTNKETLETITVDGNGTTMTSSQQIVPISTIKYFDSFTISGSSICSTSNSFPNQKFSGSGVAEGMRLDLTGGNKSATFFEPTLVRTPPIKFSVTGVRLSNSSSSFETKSFRPPSTNKQTLLRDPTP